MTQISAAPPVDGVAKTELARRRSRFFFALDRVTQIADGTPRLTDAELSELAGVLLSRRTGLAGELAESENVA